MFVSNFVSIVEAFYRWPKKVQAKEPFKENDFKALDTVKRSSHYRRFFLLVKDVHYTCDTNECKMTVECVLLQDQCVVKISRPIGYWSLPLNYQDNDQYRKN